jgi:hypothetical protein
MLVYHTTLHELGSGTGELRRGEKGCTTFENWRSVGIAQYIAYHHPLQNVISISATSLIDHRVRKVGHFIKPNIYATNACLRYTTALSPYIATQRYYE